MTLPQAPAGTEQGRAGPVAGWVGVLTALAKAGAKCWKELQCFSISWEKIPGSIWSLEAADKAGVCSCSLW